MHSKNENTSPSKHKIYYWNGILDPNGLADNYGQIIEQLVNGDYGLLDLEKLVGHNVYSVRINQSDRLLFTTITVKGEPYLMLLDEVLNHDYAKSRFLKTAVLKNYLELHGQAISEELVKEHFKAHKETNHSVLTNNNNNNNNNRSTEFARIDFYNQKFIELDENQLKVATKARLPLIISGAPGSGKSCIALLILAQYVESNYDEEYPILYITESDNLANSMQRAWQALPVAQNLDIDAVQFKSYQQLINSLDETTRTMSFVDKQHCIDWLKIYIPKYKKIAAAIKEKLPENSLFDNLDVIYQEFRIISGCKDFKSYEIQGKNQSLFIDQIEKKWLFAAFMCYQDELRNKKSIHAPFYSLSQKDLYKRIVVDEAQDFSHRQLEILANLACKKQICFCEDNRQSLSDNKSKLPFLKGLMHTWGVPDNHISLQASYRCPEAIITMANAVSDLKSLATGHGQLDIVQPHEQTSKGCVKWFTSFTEQALSEMQVAAASPDFAVITLPQYKEEAKKLFATPLVFTSEEIKGLEYKNIMVYGLLDEPVFKEADKIISEKASVVKKTGNRAKKDQANEEFGPPFSALYTAFTRATDTLLIFQKTPHGLQNITTALINAVPVEKNKVLTITTTSTTSLFMTQKNEEKWHNQVKALLVNGNVDMAKTVYLEKLHKTGDEFESFKTLFLQHNNPGPGKKNSETSIKPEVVITKKQTAPKMSSNQVVPKKQQSTPQNTSVIKTNITNTTKKIVVPDVITKLLRNVNETTLHAFFKRKNALELLFNYPLQENICLFTSLFHEHKKRETFIEYLMKYPDILLKNQEILAKCNTKDALCHPCSVNNANPLFYLSCSPAGLSVLKALFKCSPELLKSLTAQDFCRPVLSQSNEYVHVNALYMLSRERESQQILSYILTYNPVIAGSIRPEDICRVLNVQAGENYGCSSLQWLSSTLHGIGILDKILACNPSMAGSVFIKALCVPHVSPLKKLLNVSPLYSLATTYEGLTFLKTVLAKKPKLAEFFDGDSLCVARDHSAGEDANKSTLFWLSGTDGGREILLTLLKNNPPLAKSITGEALCLALTSASGPEACMSPLYMLCHDSAGRKILSILFESNPEICKSINVEALCLRRPAEAGQDENLTPLFLLAQRSKGLKILKTLLINNPEIAKNITRENLTQTLTAKVGDQANLSALAWLYETEEGIEIIDIICKANKKVHEEIKQSQLDSLIRLSMFSPMPKVEQNHSSNHQNTNNNNSF